MTESDRDHLSRRRFIARAGVAFGALSAPVVLGQKAFAQSLMDNSTEMETTIRETTRRNMSSFRTLNWQSYFSDLRGGAILCDMDSRAVHFWSEDQQIYRLYPSSVPMSDDLTRRGRTSVVQKVDGPSWAPTPAMRARNPEWPAFVPPGPDNPLGTHALYLSWQYYRVHGTHDTRKIGRRSSNGCIGLYNEHIAELFGFARVGTQVLLI